MSGSFQTAIYNGLPVGVEGAFATANPYFSTVPMAGGFVAGPLGVTIGRFGWIDSTMTICNQTGTGAPAGFLMRVQGDALITNWTGGYGMLIQPGTMVGCLMDGGDFWARSTTAVTRGQKVYAQYGSGIVSTGATGTPTTGAVFTGSIAATTLTVTAMTSGTILPGQPVSGSGVTAGTYVVSQLTGTTGGIGTYTVSPTQTASSTTITAVGTVETKWTAATFCDAGELFKMTTRSLG